MDKFSDKNEKIPANNFEGKPIKNILFVDDEESVRKIFKEALERFGYGVQVASDGDEGLDHFRKNPADLIITDIFMPGKEGHEFITDIRQEFPLVKIFAITGKKSLHPNMELDLAKSLGAIKVFTKPCKISELIAAIEEVSDDQKEKFSKKKIKWVEHLQNLFKKNQNTSALLGVGVLFLVFLIIVFSLERKNNINNAQFKSFQLGLIDLNAKIDRVEKITKSVSAGGEEANAMARLEKKIEMIEASLSDKMEVFIMELDELKNERMKTAPKEIFSKTVGVTEKKDELLLHVVQKGETLYRISRRYSLKVDELRKLNNLTSDEAIYPGQKLRVGQMLHE